MIFEIDSGRSEDTSEQSGYSSDSFSSRHTTDSLDFGETLRERLVFDAPVQVSCGITTRSSSPLVPRARVPFVTKYYVFCSQQEIFSHLVSERRALATIRCTKEGTKMLQSVRSLQGLEDSLNPAQLEACEAYLRSRQFIESVNFDYLGYNLREKFHFGTVTLYIYGRNES